MDRTYGIVCYSEQNAQIGQMKYYQNDTEASYIYFQVNQDTITPMEGIVSATITLENPLNENMTFGMEYITIDGSNLTFKMPNWALNEDGTYYGQIKVYGTDNQRLTMTNFKYKVTSEIPTGVLDTDTDIPILTELINQTNATMDRHELNYEEALNLSATNANLEIVDAREGEATLGNRIRNVNSQITDIIEVDIKKLGGIGDGITPVDSIFTNAKTLAGTTGIVYFPSGRWKFSASRPSLYGPYIKTHPNAVLVVDESPDMKQVKLLTSTTFDNPVHGTVFTKPANQYLPEALFNMASALSNIGESECKNLNFDTDFSLVRIPHGTVDSSTTATNTTIGPNTVLWNVDYPVGALEGVSRNINIGEYCEATFYNDVIPSDNPSGEVSINVITDTIRYECAVSFNNAQYTITVNTGGARAVSKTGTTPNGGGYALTAGASVTLGVKVISNSTFEFYVNDSLIYTRSDITTRINKVAFMVSSTISADVKIRNSFLYTKSDFQNPIPLKLCALGDSISYGAWSSIDYTTMLKMMLPNLKGIGKTTIDNYAVSGYGTPDLVTQINTINFGQYNYVLIMIGTNDIQGLISLTTYATNLATIANKIVADGSIPIFGIFPIWTTPDITGVPGVTPTGYYKNAMYNAVLKRFCIDNGYPIAEVRSCFGHNLDWYSDNIHPKVEGLVSIAKAFAHTLYRLCRPKIPVKTIPSKTYVTSFQNSWVNFGSGNENAGYSENADGTLSLFGLVKNGTIATTIFTLPANLCPKYKRFVSVPSLSGTTPTYGQLEINTDGTVVARAGGNAYFCLDCRINLY